ncbi:MAG TPA: threonine synthase, partial [Puia sp.]
MLFYNLRKPSEKVDFRTATIRGQGSDRGLFFPERIPEFSREWLLRIADLSNEEIAFSVIRPYAGDSIPEGPLRKIAAESIA